jgi:hypothetical protein
VFFPRRGTIIWFLGVGSLLVTLRAAYFVYTYQSNLSEDKRVITEVAKCMHDKSGLSIEYLLRNRNYEELLSYYKQKGGSEEAGRKLLRGSACTNGEAR